jgi:hypothetical protein
MDSSNAFQQYQQIDTSSIKRAKIVSERDLENEINKICDILKDSCTYLHPLTQFF